MLNLGHVGSREFQRFMSKLRWGMCLKLQNQAAKELTILHRGYDNRPGPAGQFGPIPFLQVKLPL